MSRQIKHGSLLPKSWRVFLVTESSLHPQRVDSGWSNSIPSALSCGLARGKTLFICLYTTKEGHEEGGNYREMRMNFPALSSYDFTLHFPQQILPPHVYGAYLSVLTPSFVKYKVIFGKAPFKQFTKSPCVSVQWKVQTFRARILKS